MSVVVDILQTYRAPRRVVSSRIAAATEAGALWTLTGACVLIFVAQWPALSRAAQADPSVPLDARIGGALIAWVFMAPLMFYGLAAVIWLVMRTVRRPAAGLAIRTALFWALLASTPLWLVQGAVASVFGGGAVVDLFGFVLIAGFVWLLLSGLSAAAQVRA